MLRKTMILLAEAAALTSKLTVKAFAHGDGRGHGGGFEDGGHVGGFGAARFARAALGLALFGLVLTSFALEAADADEQGRKACMSDALTVCAKFIPDREQIANCSHGQPRAHLAVLSAVARTRTLTGSRR